MNNKWKKLKLPILAVLAVLVIAITLLALYLPVSGTRPIDLQLFNQGMARWLIANNGTMPNVKGDGKASLKKFIQTLEMWSMNTPDALEKYNFIPGLHMLEVASVNDLVVAYLQEPTPYKRYDSHPTIFSPRKWSIVVMSSDQKKVDDKFYVEEVSTQDFITKVKATLYYLEKENKPYWRNVVKEHVAFFDKIEKKK